jgi:DNA-binding MarR family transcriptional regulator
MKNKTLDTIIENLFYVLPIIHKVLLKIDPPDICRDIHLSRLHLGIMAILSNENRLPISEIGKRLLIAKPQMTLLIKRLINAGLLERQPNARDKRIADITLTEKGKALFKQCDDLIKTNVKDQFFYLSKKELEDLSLALQRLREMGSRLDNLGKYSPENESKVGPRRGGNDVPKHIIWKSWRQPKERKP